MDKYKINLDRKVLKQLGSQLYGDMPSVIAELVANSYDADAKNVWISINIEQNSIMIEDDGVGMTSNDINNSFLNIGYDKREKSGTTELGRKIMGRKGIGKLAAFSLANKLNVKSLKEGHYSGCTLDFTKIIENNEEPKDIGGDFEGIESLSKRGRGTSLELIELKKRVSLSFRFIVNRLVRIFDVNEEGFSIFIRKNNENFLELKRGNLDYFSILDTVIIIGEDKHNVVKKVSANGIDVSYKSISSYDEYIDLQKGNKKLKKFPYKL